MILLPNGIAGMGYSEAGKKNGDRYLPIFFPVSEWGIVGTLRSKRN